MDAFGNTLAGPGAAAPGISRARAEPYVAWMTFLTVGYLLCELAFNARLLDVTGGLATVPEITSIERWGRVISGAAVTLALWGMAVLPYAHRKGWGRGWTVAVLAMTAAVSMSGVYRGEKSLIIDAIVHRSDGATRRAASHLRAVEAAVLRGGARIEGIDMSGRLGTPEGKSFMAVFPLIALSLDGLPQRTEAVLRDALRQSAERQAGSASEVYDRVFIPSVERMRRSYNRYVAETQRYEREVRALPRTEAGRAEKSFEARMSAEIGAGVPPGLRWSSFYAASGMQRLWRAQLHAPPGTLLSPGMGFPAFRTRVYGPMIDREVDDQITVLLRPPSAFADGGPSAEEGRAAMRALVVPPIALAFSLLGALFHIGKSANYAARLYAPRIPRRLRPGAVAAAAALLSGSAFLAPNPVSQSAAFQVLQRDAENGFGAFGPVIAYGTEWVVQAQPYFYPLNNAVRRYALFGYGFGYRSPDQDAPQ